MQSDVLHPRSLCIPPILPEQRIYLSATSISGYYGDIDLGENCDRGIRVAKVDSYDWW